MATTSPLSGYQLDRATIEVRYGFAFAHWDRAGALWAEMKRLLPELKIVAAEPGRTVFNAGRDFQLAAQAEAASVVADVPDPSLESFGKISDQYLTTLVRILDIPTFTRVGLRMWFFKQFTTQKDATDGLLALKRLNLPPIPCFGVNTQHSGGFSIRWEDENLGVSVRVNSDGKKIEFDPAFGLKQLPISPVKASHHGIVFDIDYYVPSLMPVGQFRAAEWIPQVFHVVRRDSSKVLG